jgi:hypothetical protein
MGEVEDVMPATGYDAVQREVIRQNQNPWAEIKHNRIRESQGAVVAVSGRGTAGEISLI